MVLDTGMNQELIMDNYGIDHQNTIIVIPVIPVILVILVILVIQLELKQTRHKLLVHDQRL